MGANLDRLMKSYGVSTPTVSGYSGVAAPAALAAGATAGEQGTYASALAKYKNEQDAYDRYVGDYKNRIATTDLYSSPYLNILPKSEQKYQTGNTITTPDYSALASPVTDINNTRTTPDYDSLVKAAYAGVGRSGIGSEGKNIDQAGYDYWSNQLKNNAISPADFKSTFSSSARDYVAKNTNDPITTVMRNYRPANAENPMYDALIKSAYSGIGRSGVGSNMGNIDQPGYDYWMNQLNTGAVNPANFTSSFATGAKSYIDQNPDTDTSKYMRGYLGLSPAVTGGNGSTGFSPTGEVTEAMMAANPYLRPGYGDYNGRDQYVAEMAQGGPVRHFYGGGSNSIDGGITDLADKYALDNPADLPEIYAQANTGTATDAGSVPVSAARVAAMNAASKRTGGPGVVVAPVPAGAIEPGPAPARAPGPAPVVAPQSADDTRYDKYFKPRPPSDAVIAARKSVEDNRAALLKAINDQMGKSEENAPSKAEMYFRLAAAFAAPTKTGGFMENVGLAAKELGDFQKSTTDSKRAAAAARLQMLLKTNEITLQAAQEGLATLVGADKEDRESRRDFAKEIFKSNEKRNEAVTKDQQDAVAAGLPMGTLGNREFVLKRQAARDAKEKADLDKPSSELGRKLADLGFIPGTEPYKKEYARLFALEESKAGTAEDIAKKARDAIPGPELTRRNEAQDRLFRAKNAQNDLDRAYTINPLTFKGSWGEKGEQFIKEGIGVDDPIAINTREQTNLLSNQAVASLKEIFGGQISDGERKIILELQGIGAKTREERALIIRRAYRIVDSFIAKNQKTIDEIESGTSSQIKRPVVGATDGQ